MHSNSFLKPISRRAMLGDGVTFAGSAFLAQLFPASLLRGSVSSYLQQSAPPTDPVAAFRAQMAANPIQPQKLADNLTLLSGPGGNVVVLNGADGKFVVDTFVSPAWPKLKESLEAIGNAPVKTVIDTHWHFDHVDNNGPLRAAGATILAHENTKKRMSEAHDLLVLNLHFPPSPADALPQQTFATTHKLEADGETLLLEHVAPAHTDTDIFVHFQKANVIQTGDLFFNGLYPYIDGATGGKVSGMIAACDKLLKQANNDTKIVSGHGPLGNRADVVKFREMLVTTRDRVQKLKSAGKSAQEAAAAKPLADLEDAWGKGFFNGDVFVQILYSTL
ncbi:MAG TPA: MBL fold metallo-hydrolase [Candidatus Dormibacteraeota bacterium]|nr:MBL fold metallo-hydrolase [Candidatus Dormibacteraeota bacterium]